MRSVLIFALVTMSGVIEGTGQTALQLQLNGIRVESVDFKDAEFGAVLEYIDGKAEGAMGAPFNYVILGESTAQKTLTLQLTDVPVSAVIHYACETLGLVEKYQPDQTVLIGTKEEIAAVERSWASAPVVKGQGTLAAKLASVKLPGLAVEKAELSTVVQFVSAKLAEVSKETGTDVQANFLILDDETAATPITLKLDNTSLATVVRYLDAMAGPSVGMRIDRFAAVYGQVEQMATRPVPKVASNNPVFGNLMRARLPNVAINDATFSESLEFFRFHFGNVPGNINLIDRTGGVEEKVTLNASNLPLSEAVRYVCEITGTTFTIEGTTVIFEKLPPPSPNE